MMNLYSADAIFRESEKEKHEKEILAREKEFNKKALLQIIEQQQQQIQNFQKQYDESRVALVKSQKQNKKMMLWTVVCAVTAVVSLITTIVIAIVK